MTHCFIITESSYRVSTELNDLCCNTDPFFDPYLKKYVFSKFFLARMFGYRVNFFFAYSVNV